MSGLSPAREARRRRSPRFGGVAWGAALAVLLASPPGAAQVPRSGPDASRTDDVSAASSGTWAFVPRDRARACEALGRQLRARRPVLAPWMPLPEDPLLAERAKLCGRTIDVLVEASRVELQRDDAISVSTRADPEQRDEARARLRDRSKALRGQRAQATAWLADAARERARRGLDPSATESMARVVLAWSGPSPTPARAAAALVELRDAVANGSLAPGATARLRFALGILSGELPMDRVPIALPPLMGNEGDFESAVEILAWARFRDELGLHARIEAWLRHTGNGGRGDPTTLGVGLGNADRVYLRGLIAVVGDDVDGARAWFRLLLTLDDVDPDVRDDATARLRGLEVLVDD